MIGERTWQETWRARPPRTGVTARGRPAGLRDTAGDSAASAAETAKTAGATTEAAGTTATAAAGALMAAGTWVVIGAAWEVVIGRARRLRLRSRNQADERRIGAVADLVSAILIMAGAERVLASALN